MHKEKNKKINPYGHLGIKHCSSAACESSTKSR
uniref:Uncharacterized protein n=1 Tax=Rhizophora mucronata TaxID=61149 RepID=A0A2P2IIF8_RHIMU